MAHELDRQGEWQRLSDRYRALSDGQLLDLAAGIDDLTEVAGDVLRQEMSSRRLQVERADSADAAPASTPWTSGSATRTGSRKVALMVFHDAIEAGRACDFLEAGEIEFEITDVAEPRSGMRSFSNLPPVALRLAVDKGDRARAMAVLREKMNLFPVQEVDQEDASVDDGTVSSLGDFGQQEEAEAVARVLDDARIWHRTVANAEGTAANEDCYTIEVKEVDLVKAGEVVEKALNLPEA